MQGKIGPFHSALPTKRKPPKCTACSAEYKTYDQYNAHMIRTHFYVPYVLVECALCLRQFKSEKSHDWHVRHAHGEEIPCDKCPFVATSKANLKYVFCCVSVMFKVVCWSLLALLCIFFSDATVF